MTGHIRFRFQERRKLADTYDLFLVDDRIFPMMPATVGKSFFAKKKFPVPIALDKRNIHAQLVKARDSAYVYLGTGTCASLRIGRTSMTAEQIAENIIAVRAHHFESSMPHYS